MLLQSFGESLLTTTSSSVLHMSPAPLLSHICFLGASGAMSNSISYEISFFTFMCSVAEDFHFLLPVSMCCCCHDYPMLL